MQSSSAAQLTTGQRAALDSLAADLRQVFGQRLQSIVVYGLGSPVPVDGYEGLHTLVLTDSVAFADLTACASFIGAWRTRGLAVPLVLGSEEFRRTLDVFPLEYGDIIAHHVAIAGDHPFDGISAAEADMRSACERQAKSHLIHLREGYLETRGDAAHVVDLIGASAAPLRGVLYHIALLDGPTGELDATDAGLADVAEHHVGVSATLVREVFASASAASTIADPTALLARYIAAAERIWEYVDAWRRR